jgi:hypothetical protein
MFDSSSLPLHFGNRAAANRKQMSQVEMVLHVGLQHVIPFGYQCIRGMLVTELVTYTLVFDVTVWRAENEKTAQKLTLERSWFQLRCQV